MPRHIHEGQMIHSSLVHNSNKQNEEVVDTPRPPRSLLKLVRYGRQRHNAPKKSYLPKASLKRLGRDDLQTWSDFYTATGSDALPALVERDLNDLAPELLRGIQAARPFNTPYLFRQFVFLASSGASTSLNPTSCTN